MSGSRERRRFDVAGLVQGVGFRPFVYVTASSLALTGSVANTADGVEIEVEGDPAALDAFAERLRLHAPPLAVLSSVRSRAVPVRGGTGFTIEPSRPAAGSGRPSTARASAPSPRPTSRRAPTACASSPTRRTVATGTPSSRAPIAGRDSPS